MKCYLCNKKIKPDEDYVTKLFRKMFGNKRVRIHKKCYDNNVI